MGQRRLACIAVAISAIGLSGCAHDWVKPGSAVEVAGQYRAARTQAAPPVTPRWAATFGSPELARLAEEALDFNEDIGAALGRIEQADAQAGIASAALFPAVNLSSAATRTQTPGTATSSTGPFTPTRRTALSLGLNASYEIDFWGKNRDASAAARLLAHASRFDRSVVALSSLASLVNSYFAVLAAQDRLRIARENVAIASEVLRAIQARLAVGTATVLDTSQQEAVLATQRANIPSLEQTELQTKNLIAVLVGRTPESISIRGGSLARLRAPVIKPGLPSQLLLRRPDVAEAEAKLVSEEFSVEQARAAFFPSISLTGQFGLQSMALKNLLRPEAIAYEIGAQLAKPLLDGHNLQSQLLLQKGKYLELAHLYRKQALTAFSDVENALIAVRKTTEHERLTMQAAAASRRAYDASMRRLREGTIDIVTLSTVQTTLFQNLDMVAQSRLQRYQAYVTLYQALGGGWSESDWQAAVAGEQAAYDSKDPIP
ncbi:MAG: efflux transporter outer membrane subunit [Hyphomicrobiales bacterium]|nr:efflux transporter outer membrane subunit [Hyphomicrobiales bacterium]